MPTFIDIEPALLRWQAKHNRRMTYEQLAREAGISIAALYRMKSGDMIAPDLRKINRLCKVLECEPGDVIRREQTGDFNPVAQLEAEEAAAKRELERQHQANRMRQRKKPKTQVAESS